MFRFSLPIVLIDSTKMLILLQVEVELLQLFHRLLLGQSRYDNVYWHRYVVLLLQRDILLDLVYLLKREDKERRENGCFTFGIGVITKAVQVECFFRRRFDSWKRK